MLCKRAELPLFHKFPCVKENEDIIRSDTQDKKHGENVEYADKPEVQNDSVDEVGAEEISEDAEHSPTCIELKFIV